MKCQVSLTVCQKMCSMRNMAKRFSGPAQCSKFEILKFNLLNKFDPLILAAVVL